MEFLEGNFLLLGSIVFVVLLVVLFFASYVKAPPSNAYIISGINREPRVLIGKGGFKIPFLERLDMIFLGQVTVDVKTSVPVPTHDFIDVMVDAVCKVRVTPDVEGYRLAARNFLNMPSLKIAAEIKDSLEGNMREVIGAISLQNLVTDRDRFSDEIQSKAANDMKKLGLEIISCNIQNITDQNGLIEGLGADNTSKIKKDAAIAKANADRDVAIQTSKAKQDANEARVKSETAIAEQNNDLAIKQAELKLVSDVKKAEADAAYEIQKQEQQRTINMKTVDANIEKVKREQVLSEEYVKVKENELIAQISKQADAEKYKTEVEAKAELEQRKRIAESEKYEAEQKAAAIKAQAEAQKYQKLQEAEGIKAVGEAEADALKAKYVAEAEGLEKKAEAYGKFGQAAILDMIVKIMPQMAENIAKPIAAIDNVNIYDGGVDKVSANVPIVMKQTFDTIKSVTGVDMSDVMKANTLTAKTDRNINLSGDNVSLNLDKE